MCRQNRADLIWTYRKSGRLSGGKAMAIKTTIRRLLGLRVRVTRPDILETATALGEELDEIERRRTAVRRQSIEPCASI
jgi:hypothetical protein